MYILGLRTSWGTSRVRPSWSPSGHILTPALSPYWGAPVGNHACPEDAVYSLNDSCSCFTQRLFPQSGFSPTYREYLIIIHGIAHIQIICTSHLYVHQHLILYITFIHTPYLHSFISSALSGRLAALDSLCPISDTTPIHSRLIHLLPYIPILPIYSRLLLLQYSDLFPLPQFTSVYSCLLLFTPFNSYYSNVLPLL
jgi:hypothetical protein